MAMVSPEFVRSLSQQIYQPAMRKKADTKHWDWSDFFTVKSSDFAYEQSYRYTGMGPGVATGELEPAYYGKFRELGTTTWTHSKYTLGSMWSQEFIEDNRNLPEIGGAVGEMVQEGLNYIVDYTVAQHFNRAFNSSYPLYDSVELCGTHTLQKTPATTVANEMTASSITFDTLWLAINYYEYQLFTHENLPMTSTPKYLLYHPSQKKTVMKILDSMGMEPDTTDNNKDTLKKYGLIPVECRFLTSTYWFLLSDKCKEDFLFYWRVKQETKDDADFDRDAAKIKSRIRFSSGPADWFSILGNTGA